MSVKNPDVQMFGHKVLQIMSNFHPLNVVGRRIYNVVL